MNVRRVQAKHGEIDIIADRGEAVAVFHHEQEWPRVPSDELSREYHLGPTGLLGGQSGNEAILLPNLYVAAVGILLSVLNGRFVIGTA